MTLSAITALTEAWAAVFSHPSYTVLGGQNTLTLVEKLSGSNMSLRLACSRVVMQAKSPKIMPSPFFSDNLLSAGDLRPAVSRHLAITDGRRAWARKRSVCRYRKAGYSLTVPRKTMAHGISMEDRTPTQSDEDLRPQAMRGCKYRAKQVSLFHCSTTCFVSLARP